MKFCVIIIGGAIGLLVVLLVALGAALEKVEE
jgi:hypothetical protein